MPGLVAWDLTELLRYALTVSIGLSAASAAPPYASPVGLRPTALCPTWWRSIRRRASGWRLRRKGWNVRWF